MKATHRNRDDHNRTYFDVSTEEDRDGYLQAKRIEANGWAYAVVHPTWLQPIPEPAPHRPFDYESWRALLKKHGGNVWVRNKSYGNGISHWMGVTFLSDIKNSGDMSEYVYSTDFGDTWQEMSRE